MAKNRAGHRPAGGLHSRNVVQRPVRYGERAEKIREKGVSQIGQNMGNHITGRGRILRNPVEPIRGGLKPAGSPGGVPLGNEVAGNVKGGGPGAGREIIGASGTQGCHGAVNPGSPTPKRGTFD